MDPAHKAQDVAPKAVICAQKLDAFILKQRSLRWILFLIRSFSHLNSLIKNKVRLDLVVFRKSCINKE